MNKALLKEVLEETHSYLEEHHFPEEWIVLDAPLTLPPSAPPPQVVHPITPPVEKQIIREKPATPGKKIRVGRLKEPEAANPLQGVDEAGQQKRSQLSTFPRGEFFPGEGCENPQPKANDLAHTLKELAPNLVTHAPPPDDACAKKIATGWKEKNLIAEVTILSFHPNSLAHRFLKNLERAITTHLIPAKVVLAPLLEQEKRWNLFFSSSELKHLLSFPIPFAHFPNLRTFYRENIATKTAFLHTTPLLFLHPFSEYQNKSLLKKELWRELCQLLSMPPSS